MCAADVKNPTSPWSRRAEELLPKEGHWSDYAAFCEWWGEAVEGIGGPPLDALAELGTVDHLGFVYPGDVAIYSALNDAFYVGRQLPEAVC